MGIKPRIQGLFIKMKNRFCVAIIIFCIILIGCSNNLSLEQASSSEENGETKQAIEFYTYEDVERQDLQADCKKEINLSYLSFEKFLDKIYTEDA